MPSRHECRPEFHCRTTTGPAGLTMTEQEVDDLVAVGLPEHGSRRAATRQAVACELRSSRVRLDGPGSATVGPRALAGAMAPAGPAGTGDVPAAPPVAGG